MWRGMMQGKSIYEGTVQQGNKSLNEKRIHPTQKPIALYMWIAGKYLKPGDSVIDTHVGSASSLIAYHRTRHKCVGFEIDPEYYQDSNNRLQSEKAQINLFEYMEEKSV